MSIGYFVARDLQRCLQLGGQFELFELLSMMSHNMIFLIRIFKFWQKKTRSSIDPPDGAD